MKSLTYNLGSSQILVIWDFEAARNSASTLDESAIIPNFTKSWEEPQFVAVVK